MAAGRERHRHRYTDGRAAPAVPALLPGVERPPGLRIGLGARSPHRPTDHRTAPGEHRRDECGGTRDDGDGRAPGGGETVTPALATSGEPFMTARILVVEDDVDIWRSLQILLQRAGYELLWAGDGPDGLRSIREDRPDLVILDVGLPRLDGGAVLERIRDHSEIPVILLPDRGLETDKVRGLLGG